MPQVVPGEVLDSAISRAAWKPFLMSCTGSPAFGPDLCGKTYCASGSRAAKSFSSVVLAVTLSGTESGRPLFVRGIRITLLAKSI